MLLTPDTIEIKRYSGQDLARYIPDIARLRIEVFRDFPYLYQGSLAYEERYLQTYIETEKAVVVIATDQDRVIGASTGLPLSCETDEFKRPFVGSDYPIEHIFYCAESVLDKKYRGQGLGVAFFEQRLEHARQLGGMQWAVFCAVLRPDNHPLAPDNYQPLDTFWQNRGFKKLDGMMTYFNWLDLGDQDESAKPMQFWIADV